MRQIVHDWSDDLVKVILRHIRSSMKPASRLLIRMTRVFPSSHHCCWPYIFARRLHSACIVSKWSAWVRWEYRSLCLYAAVKLCWWTNQSQAPEPLLPNFGAGNIRRTFPFFNTWNNSGTLWTSLLSRLEFDDATERQRTFVRRGQGAGVRLSRARLTG